MDNYPPGVCGTEYEISGPDDEGFDEFQCPKCRFVGLMDWFDHHDIGQWIYCPKCQTEWDPTEGGTTIDKSTSTKGQRY